MHMEKLALPKCTVTEGIYYYSEFMIGRYSLNTEREISSELVQIYTFVNFLFLSQHIQQEYVNRKHLVGEMSNLFH